MTAMRIKRMRHVWQVLGVLAVEVAQAECPPPRFPAVRGNRLIGHVGPELAFAGPARVIEVQRRPWLQRFVRSYVGWRQHHGIVKSLRAAWRISRIPMPASPAAPAPRSRPGRDSLDVSGGQLSEG